MGTERVGYGGGRRAGPRDALLPPELARRHGLRLFHRRDGIAGRDREASSRRCRGLRPFPPLFEGGLRRGLCQAWCGRLPRLRLDDPAGAGAEEISGGAPRVWVGVLLLEGRLAAAGPVATTFAFRGRTR